MALERLVENGTLTLPEEFASFSAMLCAPEYHPEIEGEPAAFHPADYGVKEVVDVVRLRTPKKVETAFAAVAENNRAGDDHYAALYAGVEMAGNNVQAVMMLDGLVKARFNANDAKRFKKAGTDRLKAQRTAHATTTATQDRLDAQTAIETGTPTNVSLDIAEPLGDTMEEAHATLGHRYVLADVNGKFKVVRKPDLARLRDSTSTLPSMMVVQSPEDFNLYHEDRKVVVGSGEKAALVNPAKVFLETAKRISGIVFAPWPATAGPNDFNMFYGLTFEPLDVICPVIGRFLFQVVCGGRKDVWRWVLLWLVHMVQRPGEKPGTALVLHGAGGSGKSTMGLLLDRLTAPHCRTLDKSEHVTGRFAGEHLATTICAVCAEAAFAGDPRVRVN